MSNAFEKSEKTFRLHGLLAKACIQIFYWGLRTSTELRLWRKRNWDLNCKLFYFDTAATCMGTRHSNMPSCNVHVWLPIDVIDSLYLLLCSFVMINTKSKYNTVRLIIFAIEFLVRNAISKNRYNQKCIALDGLNAHSIPDEHDFIHLNIGFQNAIKNEKLSRRFQDTQSDWFSFSCRST